MPQMLWSGNDQMLIKHYSLSYRVSNKLIFGTILSFIDFLNFFVNIHHERVCICVFVIMSFWVIICVFLCLCMWACGCLSVSLQVYIFVLYECVYVCVFVLYEYVLVCVCVCACLQCSPCRPLCEGLPTVLWLPMGRAWSLSSSISTFCKTRWLFTSKYENKHFAKKDSEHFREMEAVNKRSKGKVIF